MSIIKYTTDGKKVVVIGDLNQTEKIVQEIFVTEDGAEIPSGERFVVKSLLDEPAKSWQEVKLARLEAEFKKESKGWERKIALVNQNKALTYEALSARAKWLRDVAKQPHPEALTKVIETLAMFLSNEEKWIVTGSPSSFELVKFKEDDINDLLDRTESNYSRLRYDAMRLVSIYGKSNGDFEYRIDSYSDGSGGSSGNVLFFKSKATALEYMQNEFDKIEKYDYRHIETSKKHGLISCNNKMDIYLRGRIKSVKDSLESLQKDIGVREQILKDLESQN